MSCCGERRARMIRRPRAEGGAGHGGGGVRVVYLGQNSIRVRGTFSGRIYQFSPGSRLAWVDAQDSRVLLRTRFFRPG